MPRFEVQTQPEGDKNWYVESLDDSWVKARKMAIARAEVLVQLAREKGEILYSRVVVKPVVGKPKIVWQSKKE